MQSWIETHSGKKFDYTNITANTIDIDDIAHGLSMNCRFAGQGHLFYSVAEHSLHVSAMATPEFKLKALLHDASEAYMPDLPKPLKILLIEYNTMEKRLQEIIYNKYGVFGGESETAEKNYIKKLDTQLAHFEASKLYETPGLDNWIRETNIKDIELKFYHPGQAKIKFLEEFYKLLYTL